LSFIERPHAPAEVEEREGRGEVEGWCGRRPKLSAAKKTKKNNKKKEEREGEKRAGHGYGGGYHAPLILGPIRWLKGKKKKKEKRGTTTRGEKGEKLQRLKKKTCKKNRQWVEAKVARWRTLCRRNKKKKKPTKKTTHKKKQERGEEEAVPLYALIVYSIPRKGGGKKGKERRENHGRAK